MSLLRAIILGIIQGLTEFLPVSSSAHLVLAPWLFGWEDANPSFALAFDTVLHLGTLLAVVVVFWRDLVQLAAGWFATIRRRSLADPYGRMAWLLLLATLPAAALGVALEDLFESLFGSPAITAALLLVTGVLLVAGERWGRSHCAFERVKTGPALLIGLAQGLAIAPGISRSGATMTVGRFVGLDRSDAARFSFLLAIPIIAGAGLVQVSDLAGTGDLATHALPLALGFLAALISGYLVIRFLLSYLRRHSLLPFAIYCWALGLFCLVVWIVRPGA